MRAWSAGSTRKQRRFGDLCSFVFYIISLGFSFEIAYSRPAKKDEGKRRKFGRRNRHRSLKMTTFLQHNHVQSAFLTNSVVRLHYLEFRRICPDRWLPRATLHVLEQRKGFLLGCIDKKFSVGNGIILSSTTAVRSCIRNPEFRSLLMTNGAEKSRHRSSTSSGKPVSIATPSSSPRWSSRPSEAQYATPHSFFLHVRPCVLQCSWGLSPRKKIT